VRGSILRKIGHQNSSICIRIDIDPENEQAYRRADCGGSHYFFDGSFLLPPPYQRVMAMTA
jgi:hypothetical protein